MRQVSVVAVGCNAGRRLTQCLRNVFSAIPGVVEVLYVDLGSTDYSVQRAAAEGAVVMRLREGRITEGRGRNAGWRATAASEFVLFLDANCILQRGFIEDALAQFADPEVGVVWGMVREKGPGASLYQRAMSMEWLCHAGDNEFRGGNVLIRRSILEQTAGFDEALTAGVEQELSDRIRALGYRIVHTGTPMAQRDVPVTTWRHYSRHAVGSGEAYAAVSRSLGNAGIRFRRTAAARSYGRAPVYLGAAMTAAAGSYYLQSFWPAAAVLVILLLLAAWTLCRPGTLYLRWSGGR